MVPATRLAEDIFCRRHYGRVDRDPISEELCKADEIQSSVAWIFGLSMALGTIVGLLVAIPYGAWADLQRKPVYLLAATGQFANVAWSLLVLRYWRVLPIQLILLGPAFDLIGGGLTSKEFSVSFSSFLSSFQSVKLPFGAKAGSRSLRNPNKSQFE